MKKIEIPQSWKKPLTVLRDKRTDKLVKEMFELFVITEQLRTMFKMTAGLDDVYAVNARRNQEYLGWYMAVYAKSKQDNLMTMVQEYNDDTVFNGLDVQHDLQLFALRNAAARCRREQERQLGHYLNNKLQRRL